MKNNEKFDYRLGIKQNKTADKANIILSIKKKTSNTMCWCGLKWIRVNKSPFHLMSSFNFEWKWRL